MYVAEAYMYIGEDYLYVGEAYLHDAEAYKKLFIGQFKNIYSTCK